MSDEKRSIAFEDQDWTELEIQQMAQLYSDIVTSHKECKGTGLTLADEGVTDCSCEQAFGVAKHLLFARLPKLFWTLPVELLETSIQSGQDDFSQWKSGKYQGTGLVVSEPGAGKTAFVTMLGKYYQANQGNVLYATADDIFNWQKQDNQLFHRMETARMLIIDDLDRRYRNSWTDQVIDQTIRRQMDAGDPLVLCLTDMRDDDPLWRLINKIPTRLQVKVPVKKSDINKSLNQLAW